MAFDDTFSRDLKQYIVQTTSPEDPLLVHLRKETRALMNLPQMLSGPVEGKLLNMLVKLSQAKRCLEIGTFTGYSALNIASALPADGTLITCENRDEHANMAQRYFDKSPHGHKIKIKRGNALETIQTLNELFDFIFIDADKINYPIYYDHLIPKLRVGGLMVVDNALWSAKVVSPKDKETLAIHQLNQKARHDSRVETVMLSVRDGILLIRILI